MRLRPRRTLSGRLLASQLTVLAITVFAGFCLYANLSRHELEQQYEQRALSVAESVAAMPRVRDTLTTADNDPHGVVRALAADVMRSTGASYVVVVNRHSIRLSHPNPALIGAFVADATALDGKPHVGVDPGSLGRSANGKAPVFADDGAVVGEVSVGFVEGKATGWLWRDLPAIGLYTALAALLGVLASVLLARRLKRSTFDLELEDLAALLQEREAVLHGVREGIITLDESGGITLINDAARKLTGIRSTAIGYHVEDLLPAGRLREAILTDYRGQEQVVLTNTRCLLVRRTNVSLAGRPLGVVVTVRDRTEVEDLVRELSSTRGLTDALRAQQHEFANRVHTITGLLELGMPADALEFLTETARAARDFAESVEARVADPVLAALIIAKSAVAAERDVTLLLSADTAAPRKVRRAQDVVTIMGNLIDNAIDAAQLGQPPAHVTVGLVQSEESLRIRISDTGPGIPPGASRSIFEVGFTTKPAGTGGRRGLGLALVQRVVRKLGGQVTVTEGPGSVFTVTLPTTSTASAQRPSDQCPSGTRLAVVAARPGDAAAMSS